MFFSKLYHIFIFYTLHNFFLYFCNIICIIYQYLYSSQVICFYMGFWTPLWITPWLFFKIVFCQFPLKIMKKIRKMNYMMKIISVERMFPVKSLDKWRVCRLPYCYKKGRLRKDNSSFVHLGHNLISRLKKRIYLRLFAISFRL